MNKWLLGIIGLCFALTVSAKEVYPVLYMGNLVQAKSADEYGDELYLVITEFNSINKNKQYTVPNYPVHWPQEAIPKLKDLKVWDGTIANDEVVQLVVELVEHDFPPFDVDDSIGSIKVTLTNKKGKLDIVWQDDENSTHKQAKIGQRTVEQYGFTGAGGDYKVTFYFKEFAEQPLNSSTTTTSPNVKSTPTTTTSGAPLTVNLDN